jgi:hypothetical protein
MEKQDDQVMKVERVVYIYIARSFLISVSMTTGKCVVGGGLLNVGYKTVLGRGRWLMIMLPVVGLMCIGSICLRTGFSSGECQKELYLTDCPGNILHQEVWYRKMSMRLVCLSVRYGLVLAYTHSICVLEVCGFLKR